jgi:hypothetical protein
MALGTRALNERELTNVYAGLPRDRNTELATKTVTELRAVFCPQASTETAPKHETQERRSQAFNASINGDLYVAKRRKGRPVEAHRAGTNLMRLLAE